MEGARSVGMKYNSASGSMRTLRRFFSYEIVYVEVQRIHHAQLRGLYTVAGGLDENFPELNGCGFRTMVIGGSGMMVIRILGGR